MGNMSNQEAGWEKLLKIKTSGRDDSRSDSYKYPYEPTPYPVLERLANTGYIGKKNLLLDYGCGKGRVSIFLAYQTRCRAIGVEYHDRIYFFNPFSVEILIKALARVRESWYKNPREILFFFYYPSDEYITYLMERDEMVLVDEIDCGDLFEGEKDGKRS